MSITQRALRARAGAVLGAGTAVAVARIFSLAAAAVQLPLLTSSLSTSEYSSVALAIAIATYFSLFAAEPVILGFQRFPGGNDERSNYTFALGRMVAAVVLAGVLVFGIGLLMGRAEEAAAFAGWGIGIAVNRLVSTAWLMWGRPWAYAWNLIAGTGARTAVLLVMVLSGYGPLLSLCAAGLASAGAALVLSPKIRGFKAAWTSRPWPVRFGLHLAFASFAFTVLTNGNLLILAAVAAGEEVGRYAAMTQVAALTSGAVLGLVMTVAYPRLRAAWDQQNRPVVEAQLVTLQLLCLGVALAAIFLTYVSNHFLLHLVLQKEFTDGRVLAPLIMATAFASMGQISSWRHQFKFEAARVARRTSATALAGLLVTVGLTAVFQAPGAAVGVALGFMGYFLVMSVGLALTLPVLAASIASIALSSAAYALPGDVVAYASLVAAAAISILAARSYRAQKL
ncbi:hypothetical protein E3T28_14525 [Cryobacterium sinapicolor]|uniref:Membrane protein involved in the export of O-antigen and teichoic acid n=1 Tax=Cryobacterium sinapicolor TaxID=1259236 RepID=A0ABY2IXA6_9MICO|nr:hypothetical protein [Cryobacterium sinapicolor]TFC94706.1 hypothetical protein E3T28_14525 [Cryobacterium sinapicolor]